MIKILQVEYTDEGASYQIQFNDEMILWFDTWRDEDGEITGDWNKYIFHTNNEQDMKDKAFQEANNDKAGAYNYAAALEACEQYEQAQAQAA